MGYQEALANLKKIEAVIKEKSPDVLAGISVAVGTEETSWTRRKSEDGIITTIWLSRPLLNGQEVSGNLINQITEELTNSRQQSLADPKTITPPSES